MRERSSGWYPRERLALRALLIGALLALLAPVSRAEAQDDVQTLAARCRGSSAQLETLCREGALAFQAGLAGVGVLASGGAQLPGAASTLGRRFGGTPRLSASLRGSGARHQLPDVSGGSPTTDESLFAQAVQASLAAGLFDGFSPLPTIGGIFSLDVFATAGVLMLPDGQGFQGNPSSWGVGANVGVLRESFTMPGVTASAAIRKIGDVTLGDRSAGDAIQATFGPTVTSVRGVVGKDLLALGVLAGVGWDRYASDGTLTVTGSAATAADGFQSERLLYFGGVSLNLLLLQLSAEGGLAQGLGEVTGRPTGGYDPQGSTLFLSLAGRLTL